MLAEALGWQKIALYQVKLKSGHLQIEKQMVWGVNYALPSLNISNKPKAPTIEEFRFWLGYHLKLMRYLEVPPHSSEARDILQVILTSLERGNLNIMGELGYEFKDNQLLSYDLSEKSNSWRGEYLANKFLRSVTTVFPPLSGERLLFKKTIKPKTLVVSSMMFLQQALDYEEDKQHLISLIRSLHKHVGSEVISLQEVMNIQNGLILDPGFN